MDNIDSSCICGKRVFDNNALYCSMDCINKDSSTSLNLMKQPFQSNLMPSSPPNNLRFSIATTPNKYNNYNVLSNPVSLSSSFSDSDYSDYSEYSSSFTSIYNFDKDYKGFRGYDSYNNFNNDYNLNYEFDDYQSTQNTKDDDYYPSIYSTSSPIDIPRPRNKDNDNNEPVNKGTFGEKSIF